jgi:peptide/nickel transport system ATP-binding protein/oligopeptide transport system ATP-binding protein
MTGPAAVGDEAVGAAAVPAVLDVRGLHTYFRQGRDVIKVVRGVSFRVGRSGSVGLVGESGSGKSITALSVMGLIERPGFIAGGQILLDGRDLVEMPPADLTRLRGRDVAMVFQEPTAALNPLYRIGSQVAEAIRAHQDLTRDRALERARQLLDMVGIADVGRVLRSYPYQLSGGMCQRVTIATALANDPGLLILDEPTTALDTTIQAQILDIIADLKTRLETAIVFVSHDISVVAQICEDLVVMYGGRVMESGRSEQVIASPQHPYTQGLISAAMSVSGGTGRLESIPGEVPDPQHMPAGCPFQPRCPHAMPQCVTDPPLSTLADGRRVACWLYERAAGEEVTAQ